MTNVESKFRVTRCAVPAFMRVDPAIGSAPVRKKMAWSRLHEQRRVGVVGNAHRQGAALSRFAHAGQSKGRGPAGSYRNQHVLGIDLVMTRQLGCTFPLVFGAFNCLHHRLIASGNEQQQTLARPVEGRHEFGAILHGEPPGRSSSRVDQTTAILQARLYGRCGSFNGT